MEKEQKKEANIELLALIEYVAHESKHSDFILPEEEYPALFRVDKYLACRDDYRSLLIQILDKDDDDPLKQRAFKFMNDVLQSGHFDASVIFAMVYQRITPLAAKLLCDNAEVISGNGIGRIVYVTMDKQLKSGEYHDVCSGEKTPMLDQEKELILEVLEAYSKFEH